MRYFLLCLAAFVLLAVPAFANDWTPTSVTVTVDITSICNYMMTGDDIDFTGGTWTPGGGWTWLDSAIFFSWEANHACDLTAEFAAGTLWDDGLHLTIEGEADAHTETFGPGSGDEEWAVGLTGDYDVAPDTYDGTITLTCL